MENTRRPEIAGIEILAKLEQDQALKQHFNSLIERAVNFIDESKAPDYLQLPIYKSSKKSKDPSSAVASGEDHKLVAALTGHHEWIWDIAVSKNLCRIFSCSSDNSIMLWRQHEQTYIKENFGFHDGPIYDLILSADEKSLISTGKDKIIKVWDIESKSAMSLIPIESEGFVMCLSSDQNTLFVGTITGKILRIDLINETVSDFANAHTSVIRRLLLTSDNRLISCSQDKLVHVWNAESTGKIATLSGHSKEVFCLALSKDEKLLYSGGNENQIFVWNIDTYEQKTVIEVESEVTNIIVPANQHELYIGLTNGKIALTEIASKGKPNTFKKHADRITSMFLSEDETTLITSSRDKTIRVWNTNTVTTSAKYFNFCINDFSLGSFLLENHNQVKHKIRFKKAKKRPSNYILKLADDHGKEIFRLKFAANKNSGKEEQKPIEGEQEEKLVKVRFEYADEYEIPLNELIEYKDSFPELMYTDRLDGLNRSNYLSISRVNKASRINTDQLASLIEVQKSEAQQIDSMVNDFDVDGDFARQMKDLMSAALGERRVNGELSEIFQMKLDQIYEHMQRLETAYQQVFQVNESCKELFSKSSFSFKEYSSLFENLIIDKSLIDKNQEYINRMSDKNFVADIKFLSGNVVNGKVEGLSCKVENHTNVLKGKFKDGCLNGIGHRLNSENILTGRFKDDELEKKPFYQVERDGLIRIGDYGGVIRTIIKNKIGFQAEHITEDYNGPAHIFFKDGTRFTSVIDKLRLVGDVVNEHIVMYFGAEEKSYIVRLAPDSQDLIYNSSILFRIDWEDGLIRKIEN